MYSRQSTSKGMQEKWERKGYWYKKDLIGQESIVENICSSFILACGVLDAVYYSIYDLDHKRNGVCKSKSFLEIGDKFITLDNLLQRLSSSDYNAFYKRIKKNGNILDKINVLSSFYESLGLFNTTNDLKLMVYIDALLLNPDRHSNNFGVIVNKYGNPIKVNPIFDMGYSLGTGLYGLEDDNISFLLKKLRKGVLSPFFRANSETVIRSLDQEIKLNFDINQFLKLVDPLVINSIPFRVFKIRIRSLLSNENKEVFSNKIREWETKYE